MYFIKIDEIFIEYKFCEKIDAISYIVDYLERQNFEEPVELLKLAEKTILNGVDIIKTSTNTFKIFKLYEYRKCSLCYESMSSKNLLECNHNVCLDCLSNLRKNECPICRKELKGEVITDEILCNILQRTEIDEHEERQHDQLMALATELGYNPNELY